MIFVFGGAYQGKLDYVKKEFNIDEKDIFFCKETDSRLPEGFKVISGLEKFTLGFAKKGESAEEYIKKNLSRFDDTIFIADDISQGLVPMDKTMRFWREMNGRVMNSIAAKAERVDRVFCGIGRRID